MKFLLALLLTATLHAQSLDFLELFANPETRPAALATLTPGTRDYFFHTALHQQLTGKTEAYQKTITAWQTAADRQQNSISDKGLEVLENRRIISSYENNPETALKELQETLDLRFDASKPDSAARSKNTPSTLDPALIAAPAFRKRAQSASAPYQSLSGATLHAELDDVASFDEQKIRWFVDKLTAYQHENYTTLIRKALALKPALEISQIPFAKLTLTQLETLADDPALTNSEIFHTAYLQKLAPSYPTQLERDLPAHAAFLEKCAAYVTDLPPALNSLRAHVLYHHLRLQEKLGNYPEDPFHTYLSLPRSSHPIILRTEQSRYFPTPADFSKITYCPPVHDDSHLINRYLLHFLAKSETPNPTLRKLIKKHRLASLHAEARLLSGADPTNLAKTLGQAKYEALLNEVRINILPTAPEIFTNTEDIIIPLGLKNTPDLQINIYEITSPDATPSTNLDGLVPHHQRTLQFSEKPLILHRENIELPELTGPGTWIVEFISGKTSARALIKKGNLTPYITRSETGQSIRAFDFEGNPIKNLTLTLGSESYTTETGEIIVPNSPNQAALNGTLSANKLATEISLSPRKNDFALGMKFFIPREQLLANREATVHLRTQLTNHGLPIALDSIENPTLTLHTNLLGGVTTQRVIADPFPLSPTSDISFRVPPGLLSFTLTVAGTIPAENPSEATEISTSETYALNGALNTSRVAAAYFSLTSTGHHLHILGRNGEPLPNRLINVEFTHTDFTKTITRRLRTNSNGIIKLGNLENIRTLTASSPDITSTTYTPPAREITLPPAYNISTGTTLEIPYLKNTHTPTLLSLAPTGAVINSLPLTYSEDKSYLIIDSLTPGDYQLHNPTPGRASIPITVLPTSSPDSDFLTTTDEIIPRLAPPAPTIETSEVRDGSLFISLENSSPKTKLTITGKRFVTPNWATGDAAFPFESPTSPSLTRPIRPSTYLTERLLSDEMRYIINRRSVTKYPGSMLPRPGQLLYRWSPSELEQTTNTGADSQRGTNQESLEEGGNVLPPLPSSRNPKIIPTNHPTYLDFLENTSTVKFALTPNEDGTLSIPLSDFPNAQYIQIIAADTLASDTRYLPLAPSEIETQDQRIARPLDPEKNYIPTRSTIALAIGEEVEIENLLDADYRPFTTLKDAYNFLLSNPETSALRDFAPITNWPELTEAEKLKFVAQHHSHELHLFLSRRDPEFFENHIKPYLSARATPTFIDDYLLSKDLKTYLRPYAFSRLNAAEKALLAQALPNQKETIHRELTLRWKTEAPTPEAQTHLFTQTLKGGDLLPPDSTAQGDFEDAAFFGSNRMDRKPKSPSSSQAEIITYDARAMNLQVSEEASLDPFAEAASEPAPPIFPSQTKLYLAANYYQHSDSTSESLIPLNRFWLELAQWDQNGPFLSPHFNACTHSTADSLMCLALLDLPFTAEKADVKSTDNTLKIKAKSPMLLFFKETRETEKIAADSPLLVLQSFFPLDTPSRTDSADRLVENTTTGPFQTGIRYGMSMVITNPTGTAHRIETLAQIPAGAIPLATEIDSSNAHGRILPSQSPYHAPETLSTTHSLPPYGVIQLKLAFYFPEPGTFTAYPLHVSENGEVLAHTEPQTLEVTTDPPATDASSWPAIARSAPPEKVLDALRTENLSPTKIKAILWRLNDKDFYQKAIEILQSRLINAPQAFSYSLLHNDANTLADFIEITPLANSLGMWFSTPLIKITPTQHHHWETHEFDPLINPRTHTFGDFPRLTHEVARAHYEEFLKTLIWKPSLTSADHLTLTYYLFLQDRIAEALDSFQNIEPTDVPNPLQYDYLHAVSLFYQERPKEAQAIAAPYSATLPPGIWKNRFQTVVTQTEQITTPLPKPSSETAGSSPSLTITPLPDHQILLNHSALTSTTLSLYNIDLEVLFSNDPFLKSGLETSLPPIAPNRKVEIPFAAGTSETTYQLPAEFQQGNILIAAESKETKQVTILDSQLIETRISPQERTIQVVDPSLNEPLPKTYIKVYAEDQNGVITFYKDGYTDLRGKFDYLSHTAIDHSTITRLAILTAHPTLGARTQITTP